MERVDPMDEFEEEGFIGAVKLSEEEIADLEINDWTGKIIAFGDEVGAIINQGTGELILLQIDGGQCLFPVNELLEALNDFL